jgi:hypothetical protein
MFNPAEMVASLVQELLLTHSQLPDSALLYAEKPGGFQCGTCRHAQRTEVDGQGTCAIKQGPISLNDGCCLAWAADPQQLRAMTEDDA